MPFESELLDKLFPFHIILSQDLKIVKSGKSFQKLFPIVHSGVYFNEHFQVLPPHSCKSFEEFKVKSSNELLVFKSLNEVSIDFRGQVVFLESRNQIVLCFYPIIKNVDTLATYNLTLNDFSAHDTSIELLFALQITNQLLSEMASFNRTLEIKVDQRTHELQALNEEILSQNEELQAAKEELILQSEDLIEKNNLLDTANKKIYSQNRTLQNYNSKLETEVKKRTSDLVIKNEELTSQNTQLEQFAFVVAHNMRAPIARILGLVDIFRIDNLVVPQNEVYINHIHAAALKLDDVISDINRILELQNIKESGKQIIYLSDILNSVVVELKPKISASLTRINADFNQCEKASFIPYFIENIFTNIISNSIKYKHNLRNPEIHITSRKIEGFIEIIFKDNGIGIDLKKHQKHIFGLYKRFHPSVEGKGIGLYLIKKQIESQNGTIHIKSKVNEGTTIIVKLPN